MKKLLAGLFAIGLIFSSFGAVSADNHDGDKDCPDFASEEEAKEYWDEKGYSAENDPERLDRDGDGIPCEDPDSSSSDSSEESSDDMSSGDEDAAEEEETMSSEEEGGELPDTSAPYATYALLGMTLSVLGGTALVVRRREQ
ncbi:excalibur calcium-binding domain-containing protein [Halobacillus kuroshimensis]|uniref:Excalibur calcium-binding domain-containing protein n=1 Tax=Halobacillus kuroshimensis TaxID=302481 RepID=A0ABS3DR05_9BACI|nr:MULTISPECIES: excalibur calcium-binding domain-containing protein [Halobacillus]MBN8233771.1 excalibur calcium-binding domain-containing protein [Halobacillus kuroshimensis]